MNPVERRADFVHPPAVVIEKQDEEVAQAEPAALAETSGGDESVEVAPHSEGGIVPSTAVPTPLDSPQMLRRKLEEFYAYRLNGAAPTDEIATVEPPGPARTPIESETEGFTSDASRGGDWIDLTVTAEAALTMGVSSSALQDRDKAP
jgi:hypothetical protein